MLGAVYAVSLVLSVTYKPFILSIMTLSIMDLIAALSIMTFGISIEFH